MNKKLWLRIAAKPDAYTKGRWNFKSAQVCINKPPLDANEIAVSLEIDVPDGLFNRPQYSLKLTVPDMELPGVEVDPQALAQVLAEQMGINVKVVQDEV